LDTVGIRT